MTTRLGAAAISLCLIAAGACAGQRVSTDYSPDTGFAAYRTFALVSRPDSASHQLIDDRVRVAVDAQLKSKGLLETNRESADLFVGYGVVDHAHTEVYTTQAGWGWGGNWGWRSYRWGVAWPTDLQSTVETYTDGTVVVCLVDARTRRVVWQGRASDVLDLPVADPTKATEQVDGAVRKLMAKYPPQAAG